MKHTAWVFSGFQTHSEWCSFRTETVRGGCGLTGPRGRVQVRICGCREGAGKNSQIPAGEGLNFAGTGADKKFQLAQDSNTHICYSYIRQ